MKKQPRQVANGKLCLIFYKNNYTKLSYERILNINHFLKYVVTNVVCNTVLDGKFSNVTGSLGITKFQVGVHSVLANERTLSGICKWRLRHAIIKHKTNIKIAVFIFVLNQS